MKKQKKCQHYGNITEQHFRTLRDQLVTPGGEISNELEQSQIAFDFLKNFAKDDLFISALDAEIAHFETSLDS